MCSLARTAAGMRRRPPVIVEACGASVPPGRGGDLAFVPLTVEAPPIVAIAAHRGNCPLRGEIVDLDDSGEVAIESLDDDADSDTLAANALHVATCKRVPLGSYYRREPPSVTGRGTVAGITRVSGGPLLLVDTSTGRVMETVPTPRCTPDGCSFRTGTGGSLRRNGISVVWHGAAWACEPLPGRRADACASWSP